MDILKAVPVKEAVSHPASTVTQHPSVPYQHHPNLYLPGANLWSYSAGANRDDLDRG